MAYEFRIIETTMTPAYLSEMKRHRMDYKASRKFYIAQYRKTSCWLLSWLLATDWTDIKYNAEEYANCNNVNIALKPYKYPCLYEKRGTILPSYETAMQLLVAFKNKIHYKGDTKIRLPEYAVYFNPNGQQNKRACKVRAMYDLNTCSRQRIKRCLATQRLAGEGLTKDVTIKYMNALMSKYFLEHKDEYKEHADDYYEV